MVESHHVSSGGDGTSVKVVLVGIVMRIDDRIVGGRALSRALSRGFKVNVTSACGRNRRII